MIQFFFKFGR